MISLQCYSPVLCEEICKVWIDLHAELHLWCDNNEDRSSQRYCCSHSRITFLRCDFIYGLPIKVGSTRLEKRMIILNTNQTKQLWAPSTQQFFFSSSDVIATTCLGHTTIIRWHTVYSSASTQQLFFSSDVIATTCFGLTTIIKRHTVV
jgi:hypothetical protein